MSIFSKIEANNKLNTFIDEPRLVVNKSGVTLNPKAVSVLGLDLEDETNENNKVMIGIWDDLPVIGKYAGKGSTKVNLARVTSLATVKRTYLTLGEYELNMLKVEEDELFTLTLIESDVIA